MVIKITYAQHCGMICYTVNLRFLTCRICYIPQLAVLDGSSGDIVCTIITVCQYAHDNIIVNILIVIVS